MLHANRRSVQHNPARGVPFYILLWTLGWACSKHVGAFARQGKAGELFFSFFSCPTPQHWIAQL